MECVLLVNSSFPPCFSITNETSKSPLSLVYNYIPVFAQQLRTNQRSLTAGISLNHPNSPSL